MIKITIPLLFVLLFFSGCGGPDETKESRTFQFEMNFNFPGDPGFVYDHLTGDISAWWDHSF